MKSVLIGFSVLVFICVGTTAFSQSYEEAEREMAEYKAQQDRVTQQLNDQYVQQMERARQREEAGGGFNSNPTGNTTTSRPGATLAQ